MKKTVVLKINSKRPDVKAITRAARALRSGCLVAFPTETVYGLGANILNKKAVRRLCKVKMRPEGKQFTILIENVSAIGRMGCVITPPAAKLVERYWPGPLTVILKSLGGGTVGFRMPDHKVALRLIKEASVPVAVPSANLSGRKPPTDAGGVLRQLDGRIDILLDAGAAEVGVESTVVDMSVEPPVVLRKGALEKSALNKILGPGTIWAK